PTGLSPIKYLNGADWDGLGNLYYLDSTSTNALYPGDPVKLVAGLDAAGGLPTIDLATAGSTAVGVAIAIGANRFGPYVDPTNLTLLNAPETKAKDYFVLVIDDPNVIFEIQENSSSGGNAALTYTSATKNANFVYAAPAAGAAYSGVQLDVTTVAATSTLNLKLLGPSPRPDNALGYYAKWQALLNNHSYRTGVAGI
ncbi:MAG: hypothetical protein ACREBW_09100, partial [Candidatus Micrarchaeaceae archaeon]